MSSTWTSWSETIHAYNSQSVNKLQTLMSTFSYSYGRFQRAHPALPTRRTKLPCTIVTRATRIPSLYQIFSPSSCCVQSCSRDPLCCDDQNFMTCGLADNKQTERNLMNHIFLLIRLSLSSRWLVSGLPVRPLSCRLVLTHIVCLWLVLLLCF